MSTALAPRDAAYVYFIRDPISGCVKVGMTRDVPRRMLQLATMTPVPYSLLASVRCRDVDTARVVEREVHAMFSDCRVRGEWFAPDEAMGTVLAELAEADDKTLTPHAFNHALASASCRLMVLDIINGIEMFEQVVAP